MDNIIYTLAVNAIPLLLAITLHEAAHGYVARMFGDRTAEMLGRITLNPLKHIDMVGTLIVPAITLAIGGFVFGWAKPVPVNTSALRNPKRDMIWAVSYTHLDVYKRQPVKRASTLRNCRLSSSAPSSISPSSLTWSAKPSPFSSTLAP